MKMNTFWYETFGQMLMGGEYHYKPKHQRSTPTVSQSSLATNNKNNFVLTTAVGATIMCYIMAFVPLAWNNDAGSFFTDCTTMWTMYVYFFEEEKQIDYQ